MPKLKLTERAIQKLPAPDPSGKQMLHWDSELKGFAVLCSGTTNAKTYVVQRTLKDGRNRRVTIGAVNELALEKASALAADMLHDLRRGIDPKKKIDNPTLRETFERYLTARRDLRPASVALYRHAVLHNLTGWLDRPLREIDGDMVEDRHRAIAATVSRSKNGRKGDGTVSANVAMRCFRTLYTFASERTPDLPNNPVRRLTRQWFAEPRSERMVPEEKMTDFYRAVCELPHPVQRDYLLMLMFTGMRRTECASLRWEDIDFGKRILRVPAANTKSGRKLELPMSDLVHDLLVARRAVGNAGGLVFPGKIQGRYISSVTSALKTVAAASGVLISAHDLRRGFITVAESCDVSVFALKALVNHSAGNDVTAGYVQMRIERLREPVQRVADRLKQLCGLAEAEGHNVVSLARAS
jgi:integrase